MLEKCDSILLCEKDEDDLLLERQSLVLLQQGPFVDRTDFVLLRGFMHLCSRTSIDSRSCRPGSAGRQSPAAPGVGDIVAAGNGCDG
ncbi:MAG: hypothetical protein ABI614_22655 [Planctomycetota bacterium]